MNSGEKIRWSVSQRLEFIEFRLYWDDHVNRSDLVEHFGISTPQASADLALYRDLAPDNIQYDKGARTFVAAKDFRPILSSPSADQYLARLRSFAADLITEKETWFDNPPACAAVPILRRRIDPKSLRKILAAIRAGQAVNMEYQSMNHSQPESRWISPHALGFDGFRWHVRAWCYRRYEFRDFVLSRILSMSETKRSNIQPSSDVEWHQTVVLKLTPSPMLSEGARRAVELDYEMFDGSVHVETKVCLVRYLFRLLDLKMDGIGSSSSHLMLLNKDEIDQAIFLSRAEAIKCQAIYRHETDI